jgi:hypothetical protein
MEEHFTSEDLVDPQGLLETLWSWQGAPRKRMAKLCWQLLVKNHLNWGEYTGAVSNLSFKPCVAGRSTRPGQNGKNRVFRERVAARSGFCHGPARLEVPHSPWPRAPPLPESRRDQRRSSTGGPRRSKKLPTSRHPAIVFIEIHNVNLTIRKRPLSAL